jgi:putative flippase GtrA
MCVAVWARRGFVPRRASLAVGEPEIVTPGIPNGVLSFGFVGAIGFLVDGGMLTFLSLSLGVNIYAARVASFGLATMVTWYLNRRYSFRSANKGANIRTEYLRYLAVQIGGALLNLCVFSSAVYLYRWMEAYPIVPLALGAVVGLIFNFTLSSMWVFLKGSKV